MIFYFSSTGNTAWAARQLAEATGERLISIPDHMEQPHFTLQPGERIGFCFPVYAWRPPTIVLDFVSRLRLDDVQGHYAYLLCTAGDTTGEACRLMARALSEAGIEASDWFALLMPESYVGLPFMDVDTPENEKRKKQRAKEELREYLSHILKADTQADRQTFRQLHAGRWPRINSRLLGWLFLRFLVKDTRFHIDPTACRKCGRCARLCPVADIDCSADGTPRWLHNGRCMTCFSCYHHCPARAIAFGRQTRHKGQYFYTRTDNAKQNKQ